MHLQFTIATLLLTLALAQSDPRVICLDDWADFERDNWEYLFPGDLSYAETPLDLPDPLSGQLLGGHGIFYLSGEGESTTVSFNFHLEENLADAPEPIFAYIKYYTHIQTPGSQYVEVGPTLVDSGSIWTILPSTSNFIWNEQLIQINGHIFPPKFQIPAFNLNPTDYFLIDRIIITEGLPIGRGKIDLETVCQSTNSTRQDRAGAYKAPAVTGDQSLKLTATDMFEN